jgi:hypothetical protein
MDTESIIPGEPMSRFSSIIMNMDKWPWYRGTKHEMPLARLLPIHLLSVSTSRSIHFLTEQSGARYSFESSEPRSWSFQNPSKFIPRAHPFLPPPVFFEMPMFQERYLPCDSITVLNLLRVDALLLWQIWQINFWKLISNWLELEKNLPTLLVV